MTEDEIPVPQTWAEGLDCPLIPSTASFESNMANLGISHATARILDDVRGLTMSLADRQSDAEHTSKPCTAAASLLAVLEALPRVDTASSSAASDDQRIFETIRLAAVVYCRSISSLVLVSRLPEPSASEIESLYSTMASVNLTRWKKTPGIFLWVMLILCPTTTGGNRRGGFIRRKMAVAGLSIGFEDFPLGISYLRAFWKVQRWIARNQSQPTPPRPTHADT